MVHGAPSVKFREFKPFNTNSKVEVAPNQIIMPITITPSEVVDMSKAGIRADEIIRLREKGII